METDSQAPARPPSVDALARSLASAGLPHALLVDIAREAIAAGDVASAGDRAEAFRRSLLMPVVNATGVLLHTNLGRAPLGVEQAARPLNVELDLASGERGSRQSAVGGLFARLCGAEAAMVVNNNAAAVMLVLAALAHGHGVAVSRGESVEIGGAFRVPDVMEQSGATLVDVGTTNRTRLGDYSRAIGRNANDRCGEERDGDDDRRRVVLTMKVHPSNFRVEGFVESTSVAELATLPVPVVADIGSGLIDADCPWIGGAPPAWLAGEPAARQTLAAGAALVTFSGDKLLGGPQAGIIAGRRDLVQRCGRHPLARALRPGGLVLGALQSTALSYLDRSAASSIPFWRMVSVATAELERRARRICEGVGVGTPTPTLSLPGAGSVPGATLDSFGIAVDGDHVRALRSGAVPVVARMSDGSTILDLRSVDEGDDPILADALSSLHPRI